MGREGGLIIMATPLTEAGMAGGEVPRGKYEEMGLRWRQGTTV